MDLNNDVVNHQVATLMESLKLLSMIEQQPEY
jgi:hypothetical protein